MLKKRVRKEQDADLMLACLVGGSSKSPAPDNVTCCFFSRDLLKKKDPGHYWDFRQYFKVTFPQLRSNLLSSRSEENQIWNTSLMSLQRLWERSYFCFASLPSEVSVLPFNQTRFICCSFSFSAQKMLIHCYVALTIYYWHDVSIKLYENNDLAI